MAKVGVVLSGCGVYDGAEIHESVATILALDRAEAEIVFMAPDVEQMHVIDHTKGEPIEGETRNVLTEAGRIARGEVKNIAEVEAVDLDDHELVVSYTFSTTEHDENEKSRN